MPRRLAATIVCLALAAGPGARAADPEPAAYVDPFIGTLGSGFVFPGPAAPYGMVQLSPDTEGYFAYTGYMYNDEHIRGFSHVHVQSMGVPEGGNVPFMPTTGPILTTDVERYQSAFTHADEDAEPGYYRVMLDTYGVEAELTAGLRVGMHRYTFPPGVRGNVLIDAGRQIPGADYTPPAWRKPGVYSAEVEILQDAQTVVGTANPTLDKPQHYAVHFAARFDRPFASFGTWSARGAAPEEGASSVSGTGAGAYVSFDPAEDRDVVVKVGISFVSRENAVENLEAELPGDDFGFDAQRERTYDAWNDALRVIEVEGGTDGDRTSFYTALYHAQHHPNVFEDVNGEYLGHDGQAHSILDPDDPAFGAADYYANFSLWDTYRAEKPLLAMIAPDRFRDFMRSFAAIVRWGGRLPRWSLMNQHADFMNGEPALQVLADGYCRGLVPPEVIDRLYADARLRALSIDHHRNPRFVDRGWIDPSATLEHALGNFALALVADSLGEEADRDALLAQAAYWRNVFDGSIGFVRPRNSDGSWFGNPYLPEDGSEFTEGTGWQYTWLVPHDVRALFDGIAAATGGEDGLLRRLDTFFSWPATATAPFVMPEVQQKITLYGIAYFGNQYAPSNEHDLQAPWLYDWTRQPWKTQALARAYQGLYRPLPDGLPGNDDLGTMSAWYVWSALGFYPVTPGSPTYVIGSPVFARATIRPSGFTVEAPGASLAAKYVQGATLDDGPLDRAWLTHDALADGATLRLEMSPAPSLGWPSAGAPLPPSQSTNPLADFACTP